VAKFPSLAAQQASTACPPARAGLRGNYPSAIAAFRPMEDGAYREFPAIPADTHEEYDLVVVGGGISGLAAAHSWRRALGDRQKILVLDVRAANVVLACYTRSSRR
jgi:spermidine dehydrogenase